jgi:hypothetical protein
MKTTTTFAPAIHDLRISSNSRGFVIEIAATTGHDVNSLPATTTEEKRNGMAFALYLQKHRIGQRCMGLENLEDDQASVAVRYTPATL